MRTLGALLLTTAAILHSTAASAQFTYDPNSRGCFGEYRGKCVTAKLRACRGKHETYKTAGCPGLTELMARLECQNEVDRVRRECSKRTCEFAHECALDVIGNRRCASMPQFRPPYPGCR